MTVISKYGEGFFLPPEIAKKAGLSEGKVMLHVFLDSRGKNFILNGVSLHLIPHSWKKREAKPGS